MFNFTSWLAKLKPSTAAKDLQGEGVNQEQVDTQKQNTSSVKVVRNWYEERYDKLVVQRNLLLVLVALLITLAITAAIGIMVVINTKEFDPFVIQIDESTGMAKIVTPVTSKILEGNDSLARYFIKKYVSARETYNPVDFDTEARKSIRLLSSGGVYWSYLSYIKNKDYDPTLIYGQKNTTFMVVKSWSKLADKKYMLRFSINETSGDKKVTNKIAVVDFDYVAMELTDNDLDINPIGFQVKGYRVDNDNS